MRFATLPFDYGGTYYFSVFDLVTNKIFDFTAGAWVTLGSGTTPYVAASVTPCGNSGGYNIYSADVDLTALFADTARHSIQVVFFTQTGGSPAPSTDSPASHPTTAKTYSWPLTVCCGHCVQTIQPAPRSRWCYRQSDEYRRHECSHHGRVNLQRTNDPVAHAGHGRDVCGIGDPGRAFDGCEPIDAVFDFHRHYRGGEYE